MIPDINFVRETFRRFNKCLFSSSLPEPKFTMTHARTFLGKCRYSGYPRRGGRYVNSDFELRFSDSYDLEVAVWEDTVIHEMIHYYIAFKNIRDTSSHGREFRRIMNEINTKAGRHVSISARVDDGSSASTGGGNEAPGSAVLQSRWHAVAVIHFADGLTGLKVLPRVVESISEYVNAVRTHPSVSGLDLYMAKHPYFERFPSSAAFKYHRVRAEDLKEPLSKAYRIECDGQSVRVIR